MKSIFVLLIVSITAFTYQNTNESNTITNCEAILKVEKGRNAGSVFGEENITFNLLLTNKSNRSDSYRIFYKKSKTSCGYESYKKTTLKGFENVDLDVSLLNSNKELNDSIEIFVEPGKTVDFQIMIKAIKDTPYYTWGCIDVYAESSNCNTIVSNTKLSIYLPDPTDD